MKSVNPQEKLDIERKFHDEWARSIDIKQVNVRESFEAPTALENQAVLRHLTDLKGKRILDLGCGAGEASVYFALQGAEVHSVDLSPEMINKAVNLAQRYGVKINPTCSATENIHFPDEYFDYVYGSSILHHADPVLTIRQTARVLKKDGKASFIEPLKHNPLINIYRKIAEDVRTPTETAFGIKDLQFVREYFSQVDFECCWLTTLNVFLYMYCIERINPSEDRYWKRVIREHKRYEKMFARLNRLDKSILRIMPFMKHLCWTMVIQLGQKK